MRVEQLLADLQRELRPLAWRARRRAVAEARDHLLSGIEAEIASGVPADEAERRVVELFGEPAVVARNLLLSHPRAPSKALRLSLLGIGVVAGVGGTVLIAAARDSGPPAKHRAAFRVPTVDSLDDVANATSPKAAFRTMLDQLQTTHRDGSTGPRVLLRNTPVRRVFRIPEGSVYAGHSAWVAGRPGERQCWKVMFGGTCGRITRANPIVAFSMQAADAAHLPELLVGFVRPDVVKVALTCSWGTSHLKVTAGKGFVATGPPNSFSSCGTWRITFADGAVMTE